MIVNIRHKGLKLFYERGDVSKLPPKHVSKIRLILTRLEAATNLSIMQVPGYFLHQLTGEWRGFWSVRVDKNYRIVFRFVGENVCDVDYIDYH
ncbi:MAG: type II toxin-antitoxin system RelE/ParE family toxin [Chitinophagaceae bacterium]|nr:type II toxin-antitoxin system RelE/ParE family toxin [Chitinophagaceae bacterium]MCW5904677.1 type II toxin-antitoxin system RelE/ParE family toxin [Chitinophagaceae bacterium]